MYHSLENQIADVERMSILHEIYIYMCFVNVHVIVTLSFCTLQCGMSSTILLKICSQENEQLSCLIGSSESGHFHYQRPTGQKKYKQITKRLM